MRAPFAALAAGIALTFTPIGIPAPALSTDTTASPATHVALTQTDIQQIRAKFGPLGIDAATGEKLIRNLENGKLPDSALGVDPVSVTTYENQGYLFNRSVYPDGSVSLVSLETPDAAKASGVGPQSISGCSSVRGTGYVNFSGCKVTGNDIAVSLRFTASFTFVQGGNDTIGAISNRQFSSGAGTVSNEEFYIGKSTESTNSPAWARYRVVYNAYSGVGSASYSLTLSVSKDSARDSFESGW